MTDADKQKFRRSIEEALIGTADDARLRRAVAELVEDGWAEVVRGADLDIGETMRESWLSTLDKQLGADRAAAVEEILVERRLNRARAAAYRLGCEAVNRARPAAARNADAQPIAAELASLRPGVEAARTESLRTRLQRLRQEALLDLEYVADGKAMSPRLGQYADSKRPR